MGDPGPNPPVPGDDGDNGDPGCRGLAGLKGPPGSKGLPGIAGDFGAKGQTLNVSEIFLFEDTKHVSADWCYLREDSIHKTPKQESSPPFSHCLCGFPSHSPVSAIQNHMQVRIALCECEWFTSL